MEEQPFNIYKHLPADGIEALQSPRDQSPSTLAATMHINDLSSLVGWNGVEQGINIKDKNEMAQRILDVLDEKPHGLFIIDVRDQEQLAAFVFHDGGEWDSSLGVRQQQRRFSELRFLYGKCATSCSSLKVLTQKSILQNKQHFVDIQPSHNPFDKLSKEMRKELFKLETQLHNEMDGVEVSDTADLHWQVQKLLLNSKITIYEFPPGLDLDSQIGASGLWHALVEALPPDLHTIVCKCLGINGNCHVRPIFDSLLFAFGSLKVLRLEGFVATNPQLCSIAENLPQLSVLHVKLTAAKVPIQGISALGKLTKLVEFLFSADSLKISSKRMRLCLLKMPNLHSAMYKNPEMHSLLDLSRATEAALSRITDGPHTLQLRQLAIGSVKNLPEHILVPELKVLYLTRPHQNEARLLSSRFPKLTDLTVDQTNEQMLMLILKQVGKQLQVLRFGIYGNMEQMMAGEVHLDRVLDACPNLLELSSSTNVRPRCEVSQLREKNLMKLRSVVIKTLCKCHLPAGFLQQMLSLAPNLRFVKLVRATVSSKELGELAALLKQRNSWSFEVVEVDRRKKLPQWSELFMNEHFPVAAFVEPSQHLFIQMNVDCL